jgi:hypothetical protein
MDNVTQSGVQLSLIGSCRGAAAVKFDGGKNPDFLSLAKELAEEKHITVSAALSILAASKPELYESFKAACPVSERS